MEKANYLDYRRQSITSMGSAKTESSFTDGEMNKYLNKAQKDQDKKLGFTAAK